MSGAQTLCCAERVSSASRSAEEKRPFVQRLFTSIAPRYDWFNRLASCGMDRGWRRRTLERAEMTPGMRVLDVCAGTGDLALSCAEQQQGRGLVVGLDMNRAMLEGGRRKQQAGGFRVAWIEGDTQALPFPSGSFDRVLIGFSTRNLTDLSAGLGEMVRVLRPGGRVCVLETGRPSNTMIRIGYLVFLFTIVRLIGLLLTGRVWPFTYLARSVRGFITPAQMCERLAAAGAEATYVPLSWGLASVFVATKVRTA